MLTTASGTNADGNPFITIPVGGLVQGASINVTLQFTRPASGGITYSTQVVGHQGP